jgi:GWxTD domain-containing protein
MTLLENWVHSPYAAALGWTLVHSLWEGALVALLLAAALLVLRSSRARYAAGCMAMLVLLAGFILTFRIVWAEQGIVGFQAPAGVIPHAPPGLGDGLIGVNTLRFHPAEYLPWLAPLWIAGVLFFHLRGLASWMAARRLRRRGVCAATEFWQSQLDSLAARLRLARPVVLLESCLTEVPVVIGYLRPVILMPVGLLTGLPAGQVESILLHELAHVRRHDYLVNLMQIVVESLVFYHPAVWWISGVMRAERENCCDDLVVATQGDAFAYAAALTALEQNRGAAREAVLAANGGSLVKRVRRLLIQPEGPRATLTPVLSAAILTITAAAAALAWQATPPPPSPPAPPPWSKQIAAFQAARTQAQESPTHALENTPYQKWLTQDVAYIITDAERSAFKNLQSNEEWEHFIEQFWARRDPTPGTPENEFKEEHYRRIAYANQHFASAIAGWKTDRGRIYITYGPPDEKEVHPSGNQASPVPFEQWLYHYIADIGTNIIIEFIDPNHTGEYRMTADPSEKDALVRVPGDRQVIDSATPKAGATVQRMFPGGVLVSIPLTSYGDHKVAVSVRLARNAQNRGDGTAQPGRQALQAFEEAIQGPAPLYTKVFRVPEGSYHFEIIVKDTATGKLAADSIDFDAK